MKETIKKIPILGDWCYRKLFADSEQQQPFNGSGTYWEDRYAQGGNSGVGSYGKFAEFKAEVLNDFVCAHQVQSVIEFGCGDGNQLTLAAYPEYLGFDVSERAVTQCQKLFKSDENKSFLLMSNYGGQQADLTLSLDVIFHLVEDDVFGGYMRTLFDASKRFVIVYSSNTDKAEQDQADHVRHRKFTDWVEQNVDDWKLSERIPNRYPYQGDYLEGSFADFFIFEKRNTDTPAT